MGSRIENEKLIMEGDGLSTTYAIKSLPIPPTGAESMYFYFRAYVSGYKDLAPDTNINFDTNPWDSVFALGFSFEGNVPYMDGSTITGSGFWGWIDNGLDVNSKIDGIQYKQATGMIDYNNPQDLDTFIIENKAIFKFDVDGSKTDVWNAVPTLYYTGINHFAQRLQEEAIFHTQVSGNNILITLYKDGNSEYLGEAGNSIFISYEGSETYPKLASPIAGGESQNFYAVSLENDPTKMYIPVPNGSFYEMPHDQLGTGIFDYKNEPYPNKDGTFTSDPILAEKVTNIWSIARSADKLKLIVKVGANMEGLSFEDISKAKSSPKTIWSDPFEIDGWTLHGEDATLGLFEDNEGNFNLPKYLILKFPESKSRQLILDHYKIEYYKYCE